jgi:hypothetical protein
MKNLIPDAMEAAEYFKSGVTYNKQYKMPRYDVDLVEFIASSIDIASVETKLEDYVCSICLRCVREPVRPPCSRGIPVRTDGGPGHVFCKRCLFYALKQKLACPVCRAAIPADSLASCLEIDDAVLTKLGPLCWLKVKYALLKVLRSLTSGITVAEIQYTHSAFNACMVAANFAFNRGCFQGFEGFDASRRLIPSLLEPSISTALQTAYFTQPPSVRVALSMIASVAGWLHQLGYRDICSSLQYAFDVIYHTCKLGNYSEIEACCDAYSMSYRNVSLECYWELPAPTNDTVSWLTDCCKEHSQAPSSCGRAFFVSLPTGQCYIKPEDDPRLMIFSVSIQCAPPQIAAKLKSMSRQYGAIVTNTYYRASSLKNAVARRIGKPTPTQGCETNT